MAKMCAVSRLERQFATLCLFHAPTPPKKYHLMKKVFRGDGAWLAVPYSEFLTSTITPVLGSDLPTISDSHIEGASRKAFAEGLHCGPF